MPLPNHDSFITKTEKSSTSYTTETNTERVNYTYNSYGYLSTIATAETTYTLTYDVFGNTDVIKAGSNTLANYDYNFYNGKLKNFFLQTSRGYRI